MSKSNETQNLKAKDVFNLKYPNCNNGMFTLRQPNKDFFQPMTTNQTEISVKSVTPNLREKETRKTPNETKRNAEVQCSLLLPNVRQERAIQTNFENHQSKMKSRRKLDEVEYFESPRDSDYFEKPPRRRRRKDRQVEIETDDDEDYDDGIEWSFEDAGTLYARQHRRRTRKSRIPENVRMTCVRKDSF